MRPLPQPLLDTWRSMNARYGDLDTLVARLRRTRADATADFQATYLSDRVSARCPSPTSRTCSARS
jgi:hypothetical protein